MINTTGYTECYIVGGGPSLKNFDWSLLEGKFVVAINRAYEVLPNAQIVYFTDNDWWDIHKANVLRHKGTKIKGSLPRKKANHPDVIDYTLTGPTGFETKELSLRHGNNSMYAALNLVTVHLGFKKVYLLGADMRWGEKNNKATSHWHDGHRRRDPESVYERMRQSFETAIKPLAEMQVEVITVGLNSQLHTFPKKSFQEVFGDKYTITEETRQMSNEEPKLLGDKVETVIEALGGKQVAKAIERITKKPCKCAQRKAFLNNLHRRMILQQTPLKIEPVSPPAPRKITPPPRLMPKAPVKR